MRGVPPIALWLLSRGSSSTRAAARARIMLAKGAAFAVALAALAGTVAAQQQRPLADPNVNMVRGITFPDGDPYMQRQNEPSIAVSTRNPCHLMAGANDYRSVDIPFDSTLPPNVESGMSLAADAWLGVFKSFDCGQKWQSTLLPGYPQDNSGLGLALKGYAAGADPTVRAGTNGLFYYGGMVFNRGADGLSKIFMARFVDNNNKERGDPIEFLDISTVDSGVKGQFVDKPWLAVDIPRWGYGPGSLPVLGNVSSSGSCVINGRQVPAGNVYMAWAKFSGPDNSHSKLMFGRSTDCGRTWRTRTLINNQRISQGANIAVAPHDGTVYVTWREFADDRHDDVNFWIASSSDGGQTFGAPKKIGSNVLTFDQLRSTTTFRSNALPTVTADHQNRVYVAWSARGYASAPGDTGEIQPTGDARIVMAVSGDRGKTWRPAYQVDPLLARGHQLMPSLTFAAGKLQLIYYDSREDVSKAWGAYIDDQFGATLRHTIDVRGAQAEPALQPVFTGGGGSSSLEVSKYRQWQVGPADSRQSTEVGANPPNLPMYANGTTPFIGDYIDVSGLPSFPVQTPFGQTWLPNIGPIEFFGINFSPIPGGHAPLPVFHASWTDNRDVRIQSCSADPAIAQLVGQRNANIYTSRLTPGLFVGSPGNTKPLGNRVNPQTGRNELIQRGFVVFAQNTTDELKFYRFRIVSQPSGGRASFRQFDPAGPLTSVIVSVPRQSTVARTVYATSTDRNAQLLINIEQMTAVPSTTENGDGGASNYNWILTAGGLRGSVVLNPDRTNPEILDPDVDSVVPEIATHEVHDPSMFEAQFFKHPTTTKSRLLDIVNPDPENPDPENPDPENPDPENPDPENPDPENPDPENPDPENPDPENPDPENPDPENPDPENPDPENPDPENPDPENIAVLNTALSDEEIASASVTDINWRVHNSGNTTSAYRFSPSLPKEYSDQKYQLIVSRRMMTLTVDDNCKPIYKSVNQVLVNIENFEPRTPDPENPDPENPDPENPDPENPDPENPDPENPDPENANFFLAPDETATVTLRVFDLEPGDSIPAPSTRAEVAAKTAAQAANTGETQVTTSVTGPDLALDETPATAIPSIARPGRPVLVSWTLVNRGTGAAIAPSGAIKSTIYLSADDTLDAGDTLLATLNGPATLAHCAPANTCTVPQSHSVTMPPTAGQYYLIIAADRVAEVFEADKVNNIVAVPVRVDLFQAAFVTQPSATTQDFTMAPPVTIALSHPDGAPVTPADVAAVTLAIQNNASVPPSVLSGTLAKPNLGGIATFNDLSLNRAGNGFTLSAAAPSTITAVSGAFNIETDLPPVVANNSYTVLEDQVLTVAAPGVLGNDSDPVTKGIKPASYVFDAAKQTDPANGIVTFNANGGFTFAPSASFAGSNLFTYAARDGRPGNATAGTVTLTVTQVNDAPSFTKGANETVLTNTGAHSVPGWATAISRGAANESAQTLTFLVSNDNTQLFTTQPAVSAAGTLTYTLRANRTGVANVTVRLRDNGGTANGGIDTSAPQTFTITVTNAPTTFVVTNTNDSGAGSLRQALINANANASADSITFNIPGGGVRTITPLTALPVIVFPATLNATTQPGYSGTPLIELNGASAGAGAKGLQVQAGNVTIRGFIINRFSSDGVKVEGDNTLVAGNWIGTNSTGTAAQANGGAGVAIAASSNIIGGAAVADRNVLSGNALHGVVVQGNTSSGNAIKGNYIGTNAAGTAAVPNLTHGVWIETPNTVQLGGDNAGEGNVISGNKENGVQIYICPPSQTCGGHVVAGNKIGTNAAGTAAIGNQRRGIAIFKAPNNVIRGNLISGNGGAEPVLTFDGSAITLQGEDPAIDAQSELHYGNQVIVGNKIGTDINGTSPIANLGFGIVLSYDVKARIGGPNAADRNVIAYNVYTGVHVGYAQSNNNTIQGNYIGVNAGLAAAGNENGIYITNSSSRNTVSGNVVSSNTYAGIVMAYGQHDENIVTGNFVGTDAAGTLNRGNGAAGIQVSGSDNVVSLNRIANNGGIGLLAAVDAGVDGGVWTGNRFSQNLIYNNSGLGIDLGADGVTANDAGDSDTGINNLQNFPVLTGAFVNGGATLITGTFNGAPSAAHTIELFTGATADASGYGEGQSYMASLVVNTDPSGNASFSTTWPASLSGSFVTATATDANNNTSEFSQARLATVNTPPTATGDQVLTVSDFAMTTNPSANDVDADVAGPEIRTTYRPISNAFGPLNGPGDVAVVMSTNRGYFTGGNQAAGTMGKVGILDLATNALVGTIPLPGNFAAAFSEVDQAAELVFFRAGINLLAVDARPASATFNQLVLNINLGTINSWALDAPHHRLYITTQTTGLGLLASGRVTVIDTDRTSPAFLQVIAEAQVPSLNGTATAIGVNTVTNKLYVSVTGASPGLYAVDPATLAMTQIFATTGLSNLTSVAVNDVDNLIYSVGGSMLHAVDGVNNTKIGQLTLTGSASAGPLDSRLLIHRTTGRVYIRLGSFPNPSNLVVVDGKRGSPGINTVVTAIVLGRENGSAFMALDEGINRLIATSPSDLRSHVIDTTSNTIAGTIMATQALGRVSLDSATHRAYLTGGPAYIKVANLATAALVTDVHVATVVWGIAVDPLTHSAYVSETGLTTAVKRLDETGISGAFALPHGDGREVYMARNSATNKIYALNGGATVAGGSDALPGFVHVIDGSTGGVTNVAVGTMPFGVAIDEVNNKIYVGNLSGGAAFPGGISILDGVTNAVVQADVSAIPAVTTPPNLGIGRDMVVTASGRLYFRVTGGATTQMLGMLNGTVATPINLGNVNINLIKYNPATNRLYVGAAPVGGPSNQIIVIDPATNAVVTTLTVGSPSDFITTQSYVAVNTQTNRLFVSDFEENQLVVLDATSHAVVATLPMPFGPSTVAVDEVRNRIYVGNAIDRSLTIVDGATLRVARTLALPIAPVTLFVDSSLSPARIFAHATENEGAISVIDDPGTAAPQITSVTQGAHGTVTLNADGSVTYEPGEGYVGTDSYTYTTSDGNGGSTTGTANVQVYAQMSIAPATLPNSSVGANYSQQLTTAGGSGGPVSWSISGFAPGGLHLSASGLLAGTLQQSGAFTFTVNARDLNQPLLSESHTYTVIVGPPVIAPTGLASATINVPYSQQLFPGGAIGTVTWTLNTNGHPGLNWLSLSNSGVLSGTPTTYGTTPSFSVTATDSSTPTPLFHTRTYTIFVGGPPDMVPLAEGIVLETPNTISFLGGNGGTRTATVTSGSLPPGLSLNSNGSWSGSPLRHGTYNFTLELKDCQAPASCGGFSAQTTTKNIQWRVSAKDQQGAGSTAPAVPFGGSGGVKIAQVFTVGAQGTLTGIGLSPTCPTTQTPLTIEIQRLTSIGVPDGTTIASGTSIYNLSVIQVAPALPVAIGEKLAFVLSAPLSCSINTASGNDGYNGGDAYSLTPGGEWTSLFATNASRDVPNFRTLIQPSMPVTYHNQSRNSATATKLISGPNNGKVLIAGGGAIAELYDPAASATQTPAGGGTMVVQRQGHTATRLADGRILAAGGRDAAVVGQPRVASAELYNPATNTWSATGAMSIAREHHRAVAFTLGPDEYVLITGGVNSTGSTIGSAEIYNVTTGTFSSANNMLMGRQAHAAVLLGNGKILLAGGYTATGGPVQAELFDPATGTFTPTAGNGAMVVPNRGNVSAVVLDTDKVLITGGQSGDITNTAEIYSVASNGFTATSPMLSKRMQHTSTLLGDGSVLIAGGYAEQPHASYTLPLTTMERYIPGSNTFVSAGAMATRRERHSAIALSGTTVLLAGGTSQGWMSANTAEIYDQASTPAFTPITLSNGTPGQPYAEVFNGQFGTGGPYSFALIGELPPGLGFNTGGTIAGTPTTTGLYQFAIAVSDNGGNTNVQSLTLMVGNVNTITSPYRLTPDAGLGNLFSRQLQATGMNNVWSLLPASSPLPPGITMSSGGLLEGTPAALGYFNFGVRAVDNNGAGVAATKILSISVNNPLSITTTSLGNADLFSNNLNCLSTNGGNGSRFYTILSGTPPPGLTLSGLENQNCFAGTTTAPGTYNFTVKATDQSVPPQEATKNFTVNVWVVDQTVNNSGSNPALSFGAGTGVRLSQRLITGIAGTLRSIRVNSLSCNANGTSISAEIQGLNAAGAPDGDTIAIGTGTFNGGSSINLVLNTGVFFAADAPYTVVLDAGGTCSVRPWHFDSYPGEGYVSNGGGAWTALPIVPHPMYDVPVLSLLEPVDGLRFMSAWRGTHTETLLPDGKVLIAGGYFSNAIADLYNPATNTMAPAGTMTAIRQGHTATLLADGTVLLTGGTDASGTRLNTAEIYDPNAGSFTPTTGAMTTERTNHSATLLGDGKVLIAGGSSASVTLNSAELFDPANGTFTATPANMGNSRTEHTATLLASGKVLLAGGFGPGNNNAVIYDPIAQTFTVAGSPMTMPRGRHTATLLADQTVLIAGGSGNANEALSSLEIYDPGVGSGTFSAAGNMSTPRVDHAAALLSDGSVLISGGLVEGGCCNRPPVATMERYVPGSGVTNAGSMIVSRYAHTMTALGNGKVLVAGTYGWSSAAGRTAELFDAAAQPPYLQSLQGPHGTSGQSNYQFTLVPEGGAGGPYTITLMSGALPGNVSFNGTNQISGNIAAAQSGTYKATFRIVDNGGRTSHQVVTIKVDPVLITTSSLPAAYQGEEYTGALAGTASTAITWSITSGALPNGLTLNSSTGEIEGTPVNSCCGYFLTFKATDTHGQSDSRTLTINLQAPLSVSTLTLGDGLAGSTYFGTLFANGNYVMPLTWQISGEPVGLQVDQGTGSFLTSSPAYVLREGGQFTLTAQVTDSSFPQQTASRNIPLKVLTLDQQIFGGVGANENLASTRRIAQVFRASTAEPLQGVRAAGLTCTAGVVITASVFPVTLVGVPDESGPPLATSSRTADVNGNFSSFMFASPVSLAQRDRFAVIYEGNGACTQASWATFDHYPYGDGFISDNHGAWTSAFGVVGRYDLPHETYIYPPSSMRFLAGYRQNHATAVLNDGRLLLVGGASNEAHVEIYDPATGTFSFVAQNMSHSRLDPTATTLPNGKVLIAGGSYFNGVAWVASADTQLFDPSTGTFTNGANMSRRRVRARATLLNNGHVLISGGQEDGPGGVFESVNSADLFDGAGNKIAALHMDVDRAAHTSTLLADGTVLILGGWTPGGSYVAERYDPQDDNFLGIASSINWPSQHTATLITNGPRAGQVLIAGGNGGANYYFDPATDTFSNAPTPPGHRLDHAAVALPNGRILLIGGTLDFTYQFDTSSVEVWDPMNGDLTFLGDLVTDRQYLQADAVMTPHGLRVAVSGGSGSSMYTAPRSLELFDPSGAMGSFAAAEPMSEARRSHVTVELDNGTVLLAGNDNGSTTAEVYNPLTEGTSAVDDMVDARCYGCAYVKLQSGKVLIAGGGTTSGPVLNTAEIYNPANGEFNPTNGDMTASRLAANAVLLDNGKVLILGGHDGSSGHSTAELFDPVTETFTATGSMSFVRIIPAVIKLHNGKVLVAGGTNNGGVFQSTAEIYDPGTGLFTSTGNMVTGRQTDQPVLLDDGRVLITGGWNGTVLNHPEVYNPGTGIFTSVGSMTTARDGHVAVKLASGVVVVGAGLNGSSQSLDSAEMFNPVTNTFTRIANLPSARVNPKAILLADGRIMIAGGTSTGNNRVTTIEFYVP